MRRQLKAYKRKHGLHHPLLALDFENNPKTGAFICAGVYGDIRHRTSHREDGIVKVDWTTKRIEAYYTDIAELEEFLLSLKKNSCLLVFYNLSYDRWFLDRITDHSTVLAVGQRVITIKLNNGLKCMDLFNHPCEGTLEDWILYLDMTKKYGIRKAKLTDYYDRVMNDTKATFHLGNFLEDFYYYECNIPLQLTVGSAAMKLFTMRFFTDYWERDSDFLSLFERRAYFGGRTELFKRGKIKTWSYDVNSMYLSIMRDCVFPDMATGKYIESPPKNYERYLKNYLGIWDVRVRSPEKMYIPLLPVKLGGKLKFPTGIFTGVWTSVELLEAIKNGYEILSVNSFIYYARKKTYFTDYAKFIWGKRLEYKKLHNKPMDKMIKRLGNALYGKFAQRNSHDYFGRLEDYKGKLPDVVKFIDYGGKVWLQIAGESTPASFEFPAISAFVSSYARLKLFEGMQLNKKSIVYVDTDCIKLSRPAVGINIGYDLGEWSLDVEGIDVIYHRPKLYGDIHKGVPKRAKLVERTAIGETWLYDKPLRYKEAIKKGSTPNMWEEVLKHLSYQDDKRKWHGDFSTPLNYNEDIDEFTFTPEEYEQWLAKRYAPKYVYGARDYESDYPQDDSLREAEDLENRRTGNMIYQRRR
ncbi:MAG: hypothetical protein KKD11_08505 [Candidatus Omnitrophica bacterium]|nr:hypothetical protein [Candidatus Omnitrophota bacterium]